MTEALSQTAGENMLVGVFLVLAGLLILGSIAFQWFIGVSAKTDKLDAKLEDGKAIAYIFFRIYAGLAIVVSALALWAMSMGLQIQF